MAWNACTRKRRPAGRFLRNEPCDWGMQSLWSVILILCHFYMNIVFSRKKLLMVWSFHHEEMFLRTERWGERIISFSSKQWHLMRAKGQKNFNWCKLVCNNTINCANSTYLWIKPIFRGMMVFGIEEARCIIIIIALNYSWTSHCWLTFSSSIIRSKESNPLTVIIFKRHQGTAWRTHRNGW